MANPLVNITSDCHLQISNWARHPDIKGDSFHSFFQVIDHSLSNNVPLILAGDILDKRLPDPDTVGFMLDQIDSMLLKQNVYFIQGQHEMSRGRPWLRCTPWAQHVHGRQFRIGGIKFYGLDFTPADRLHDALDAIPPDTDVLVAHQVWKERMGIGMAYEAAFSDIPYVKVVISGDFHAHKITTHTGKSGQKLTAVSPGSTYTVKIDEDHNKFFFTMYDDLTFKSIKLNTRPIYRYTAGNKATLDDIVAIADKLQPCDQLGKPIVVVDYADDIPDAYDRLVAAFANTAHLFARPLRRGFELEEVSEAEAVTTLPDQSGLELYLNVESDSPAYKTALRLLRSNDVKAEVKQIVNEMIQEEELMEKHDSWTSIGGNHGNSGDNRTA